MPIGATMTFPLFASVIPSLAAWSVTVAVGLTANSAPSPLGTSMETIGFPLPFIARMRDAYGSLRGAWAPMPNNASTIRSADRTSSGAFASATTTRTESLTFS